MTEKMSYTVDDVLEKIGSFGLYQIRLICLLSVLEWFVSGYQTLLMTFIAAEPKWRCVVNSTECTEPGSFTPKHDYYKSRCNMNSSEWEFTTEFTSIVTDYNLICDRTFLASLSSSLVFGGWIISALAGGFLADRFGRKKLILLMFAMALFGFLSSFPKVYWLFALLRLLVGMSKGGAVMPMFVIITEYVGKRHRHVGGTVFWFSWVFSLLTLGGFAYFIRNWRTLSIVIGATGICGIVVWPFIPESSRYLLVKGRVKETEKILRKIAEVNKKEYPDVELVHFKEQTTGNIRDLFHSRQMTHKTLVSWFCWMVTSMVYYGVTLSSPNLGGNMYLNYTLTTLMELPAYALAIWTMGRFGRKKSVFWSLVVASIASIGAVLCTMYDKNDTDGFLAGRITFACIAKLSISLGFAAIYVYSAELFPTVVRSLGMGSSSAIARVGSFSSPYIATLDRVHIMLPYTVMGALSLLAGILCMTLPETKDIPLDEVVEGASEVSSEEHELEDKALLTDGMEKGEAETNGNAPQIPPEKKEADEEHDKGDDDGDKEVLISNGDATEKASPGDEPVA